MTEILHLFANTADNLCYVDSVDNDVLEGGEFVSSHITIRDPITEDTIYIGSYKLPKRLFDASTHEEYTQEDIKNIELSRMGLDIEPRDEGIAEHPQFTLEINSNPNKNVMDLEVSCDYDAIENSSIDISDPSVALLAKRVIASERYVLKSFVAQKIFLEDNPSIVPNGEPIKPYMYVLAKLGLDFLNKAQAQMAQGTTLTPKQ